MNTFKTMTMAAFVAAFMMAAPAFAEDAKPAVAPAAAPAATPAAPAAAAAATQATPGNLKIAVVDIQALLKDSKAAQDIETQLTTIRKNFQAEVEKEEKTLRDSEKKIMDQRGKISEDELKTKAAEFQKQVAASQKKVQDRKNKLDKALATAIGKLRSQIVKIVAEIGDKSGLDLVLARTDVVIVAKSLDVTAQVLERINAELPTVKVVIE